MSDSEQYRRNFLASCRNLIQAELFMKYEGKLEGMTHCEMNIEYRRDDDTLRLLEDGTLPMPFKDQDLPIRVWYYRATFQQDPSKSIELLIAEFDRLTWTPLPLGMHNGQKWIDRPRSLNPAIKSANSIND
jgi:hypothetical protein